MRRHAGTALQLSPIARQQRALAGLGFLGAANSSVYSGPPVGVGAGKGAETGAMQGAALGTTIMPGIGTAIGAVVGAIGGAIAGAIGKQDPEIQNFNQAIALWQSNPDAVYKLANKYLVLAGFFDLTPQQAGRIRVYRQYGRMGEEPFTRDFTAQIYRAAQTGAITPQDSAQSIYQKVILPWEDSWGFGPEPSNPHSDFMDRLLTGMILDYATGYGPKNWFSRSGPLPASFTSIPPFQFPIVAAAPVAGTNTTPNPGTAAPQVPQTMHYGTLFTNERANIAAGVHPPSTAVGDAAGNTFELGTPIGNGTAPLYVNGTLAGSNANAATVAIHNGQAYLKPSPGVWGDGSTTFTYVNGSWSQVADPFAAGAPVTSTPPVTSTTTAVTPPIESKTQNVTPPPTAVSVPVGFALVGTANNLQAYVGADGLYYSWSGTNMSLLTGTLTGLNGAVANVVNGQLQATPSTVPTAVATTPSQPQIIYTPSAAPVPDYSSYTPPPAQTVTAPPTVPVTTSGGVPTWAWLGAGVAVLYLVMGRRGRA